MKRSIDWHFSLTTTTKSNQFQLYIQLILFSSKNTYPYMKTVKRLKQNENVDTYKLTENAVQQYTFHFQYTKTIHHNYTPRTSTIFGGYKTHGLHLSNANAHRLLPHVYE